MPIEKVIFSMSSPSAQGLGAYELDVVRPDTLYTFFRYYFGLCYDELSFILWYMDKNCPLPLDNAFDEFRERDYERRKAEGFPKPLFPSDIPTPEATPEQQKERKKVGGW